MRTLDAITQEISELTEKISVLQSDVKGKTEDLEHTKKVNARLLAENIGKQKKPASVGTQKSRLIELSMDIDQANAALEILQGQLEDLRSEQQLVTLWGEHVPAYERTQAAYFAKLEGITAKFMELSKVGSELQAQLEEFLNIPNINQPLSALSVLSNTIRDGEKIEKDLGFPIFKEIERYRVLNDFLPFQGTVKTLLKAVDRFTDRLFQAEYTVCPTLTKWLSGPAQGASSGRKKAGTTNVFEMGRKAQTHSEHTMTVQRKFDHQGRKVKPV
ncbi:hypothetical protein PITCH_A720005 [uncultured Desulfobacterium sp.]|uniref:Uncharacterized protein n=1 Tax=uncultured Desulfobacterium sp. TaxID=201089 RepID=A0A445N1T5_9BACT|nr:hypothetical protein PITCH_A1150049 [uncultured Desulfobacterium sp.]SPD75665.1 hypothetical protein PITCH_A720005 [uncultured Desulfobacterium sp.]